MAYCYSTTSTADHVGDTAITALHPDIIHTNILTRLDGPTLASVGCASPQLHALCTEEKLWRDICNSHWTSINDPRVLDIISTFPAGHRSFFSDSFPTLLHLHQHKRCRTSFPSEIISAVDIHYQNSLIYSKVEVTETVSQSFLRSPLWVDLLNPKEMVRTQVKIEGDDDTFLSQMKQSMTLSWIVIDPAQKRAANVSSLRPVLVQRHWLTEEIKVRYATILAGQQSSEFVQCRIEVTCVGKEGEEVQMREVNLQMHDMDRKGLSGKESLVILQEAMNSGNRNKEKRGEANERYEKYLEMRRVRSKKKQGRQRILDGISKMVCRAIWVNIFLCLIFWLFGHFLC